MNYSSGIFGYIDDGKTLLIILITLPKKTIREKPIIDRSQIRYHSPAKLSWSRVLLSSYTSCYERLAQKTFWNLSLSLKRWGLIIITCHIWVLYSAVLKSKGLSGTRNDKNLPSSYCQSWIFLHFCLCVRHFYDQDQSEKININLLLINIYQITCDAYSLKKNVENSNMRNLGHL